MKLTLGTAQLGMGYGIANRGGRPSAQAAAEILTHAVRAGVGSFDTAPAYGDAERILGEALEHAPVEIVTKLPRLVTDDVQAEVRGAVEASRRRLRRDRIDVYLIHDASDLLRCGRRLTDALLAEEAAGRIGRSGVSLYDPVDRSALEGLSAIQFPFNLFDRRFRGGFEGFETYARSPLLQGLFALPPAEAFAAARPWLARLRSLTTDPVSVAIAFARDRSGADHLLLGVETVAQLDAALAAVERPLDPELARTVEGAFEEVPADVFDPRRWP